MQMDRDSLYEPKAVETTLIGPDQEDHKALTTEGRHNCN